MKRTLTTLTTLAAAAIVSVGIPGVAAQTTQASEPNYEFILDEGRVHPTRAGMAEAIYEFQLDDGRSASAAARSPVVSYEFILERPSAVHAQMSAATNYEIQPDRDGGSAPSAMWSAYASTATWREDAH